MRFPPSTPIVRKDTRRIRPGRDPLLIRSLRLAERVRELYTTYSRRVVETARRHGKASQVWIKNYRITQAEEGHIALATGLAREAGCENLMAWSWKGSQYLSWLASQRPGEVHRTQLEAFLK